MNDVATTLRRHYGLELPAEIATWLDDQPEVVSTEALTGDAPPMIWPALMPCHLLPVVPWGQGDWLALRLEIDVAAPAVPLVDVVLWSHGGGDWLPWPVPGGGGVDVPAAVKTIARAISPSPSVSGQNLADGASGDWLSAGQMAQSVADEHPDLAWTHEIAGHAAGGKHHHAAAAIRCSSFTDQSVTLGTHWSTAGDERPLKGAWAAGDVTRGAGPLPKRLGIVADLSAQAFDQYRRVVEGTPTTPPRRSAVTDFWLQRYDIAALIGDWTTAMRAAWAAGWDVGGEPMGRYAIVIDRFVAAAGHGGYAVHHRLATAHRACLKQRFGL